MFLDNLPKECIEAARFHSFKLRDINPLGKTIKERVIYAPNDAMRAVHRELLLFLRGLEIDLPYATGGMPGSNPLENVKRHAQNRYFYLLDIHSFYSSIKGELLGPTICSLSSALDSAENEFQSILERFCLTPEGSLMTGAPTSPDLANLFAGELLDKPLGELARRYGLTYTRYLDDMTFSSSWDVIGKKKRWAIRKAILDTGFSISHHKSRIYDLRQAPIVITGVGLDFGGKAFLPRHFLRKIRQVMYLAIIGKVDPAKVHGMMVAFWASTGKRSLNLTELRLVRKYRKFCRLMLEEDRR